MWNLGTGDVLIGEVSMCNDDNVDNRFYERGRPISRRLRRNEPPYRLLCNEYPDAAGRKEAAWSQTERKEDDKPWIIQH